MHFKVNLLPLIPQRQPIQSENIIPHFRVKNLFFVNLTAVDHYPVIKLVPLDL